jgi:hypothetical protein
MERRGAEEEGMNWWRCILAVGCVIAVGWGMPASLFLAAAGLSVLVVAGPVRNGH